jgi:hypothetical protein
MKICEEVVVAGRFCGRDEQDVEHHDEAWSIGMARAGWTEGFGGARNTLAGMGDKSKSRIWKDNS